MKKKRNENNPLLFLLAMVFKRVSFSPSYFRGNATFVVLPSCLPRSKMNTNCQCRTNLVCFNLDRRHSFCYLHQVETRVCTHYDDIPLLSTPLVWHLPYFLFGKTCFEQLPEGWCFFVPLLCAFLCTKLVHTCN